MHEQNGTKSIILCVMWTGKGVDDENYQNSPKQLHVIHRFPEQYKLNVCAYFNTNTPKMNDFNTYDVYTLNKNHGEYRIFFPILL